MKNVYKLDCAYQLNGEQKEEYNWNGLIIADEHNISGMTIDQRANDKGFIYAINGIRKEENRLEFVLFPGDIDPVDYIFAYDEEDKCFYGVWYYVSRFADCSYYGGYAKLSSEMYFDMNQNVVQNEIDGWKASKYRRQYDYCLYKMNSTSRSNLNNHFGVSLETFNQAKEYFKNLETKKK